MNETQHDDTGFESHRLRTIADMRRSRDDRMLAGVCSGAARYLNVDPVVVRVVIAVLTFVGLAGAILYAAAWFLIPPEDSPSGEPGRSIASDWFNLDKNEEQVRAVGLLVAAVLAALAVVGDHSWGWGGALPWILLPVAFLYWLFVVRPRRRHAELAAPKESSTDAGMMTVSEYTDRVTAEALERKLRRRAERSPALTVLTLSVAAIAVAVALLIAQANDGTDWTSYVAIALAVVSVGLLVGTRFGQAGPLVPIGGLLAVALAVGTLLPSPALGERRYDPLSAADVNGSYEHGIGKLQLDLADLTDADQLTGSTVSLENGIGEMRVIVPSDLNVVIDAELEAGEIRAFDRKVNGTDNELTYPAAEPDRPALTLKLRQGLGNIEVIRR
ncbi:PspC domain-containing protein [Aeromicrobium terrae]|nr:PspC domain-containing protein [Aeromicrobium terrae]